MYCCITYNDNVVVRLVKKITGLATSLYLTIAHEHNLQPQSNTNAEFALTLPSLLTEQGFVFLTIFDNTKYL